MAGRGRVFLVWMAKKWTKRPCGRDAGPWPYAQRRRAQECPDAQNTAPAARVFLGPFGAGDTSPVRAFGRMNYTFSGFSGGGPLWCAAPLRRRRATTYVGTEHLLLAWRGARHGEAAAFLLEKEVYGYQVGGCCASRWAVHAPFPKGFHARAFQMRGPVADFEAKAVSAEGSRCTPAGRAPLEGPGRGAFWCSLAWSPPPRQRNAGAGAWGSLRLQVTEPPGRGARAAEKYGKDLTSLAEQDKLDPVLGRDSELLRMEQILVRRRAEQPLSGGRAGRGQDACGEGWPGASPRYRRRPSSGASASFPGHHQPCGAAPSTGAI